LAKTKTKPGPKPKHGERQEIHVELPVDDLNYISGVTENRTQWILEAVKEKRQREERTA